MLIFPQTFKDELKIMLFKLVLKIEREEILPNFFHNVLH